jgi:hypothetical protein
MIMSDDEQGDGLFRARVAPPPFENLVALHVRWPGNRLGRKFPINLLLEVEDHHLEIRIKPGVLERIGQGLSGQTGSADQVLRLRIRLRHCYVRYRSREIDIIGDSKYESPIAEGKFEFRTFEKSHALTRSQRNLGLRAEAALKPAGAGAALGAHANAALSRQATRTIEATSAGQPDIYEVRAVPNGWRIGHPEFGDPNELSYCLDGRYFHRPIFGCPQTCEAEFREGRERGKLTFAVTVRDGLHVERIGGGVASETEKDRAEAAMRDRIAAIRLERHLGRSESRPDGEMPIAAVTCEVVRAADYVTIGKPSAQLDAVALAHDLPNSSTVRRRRSRQVVPP